MQNRDIFLYGEGPVTQECVFCEKLTGFRISLKGAPIQCRDINRPLPPPFIRVPMDHSNCCEWGSLFMNVDFVPIKKYVSILHNRMLSPLFPGRFLGLSRPVRDTFTCEGVNKLTGKLIWGGGGADPLGIGTYLICTAHPPCDPPMQI